MGSIYGLADEVSRLRLELQSLQLRVQHLEEKQAPKKAIAQERHLNGNSQYVDDRDLARLTPFSRAQWQAWRREGGGPPWRKVGRRCVYHWPEVKAWLDKTSR